MAIIIASLTSYAQTKDLPWQVSLSAGLAEYSGDIGNGFFLFDLTGHNIGQNGVSKKNTPGLGLISVNKYLNSRFDLSFRGYYGVITETLQQANTYSEIWWVLNVLQGGNS